MPSKIANRCVEFGFRKARPNDEPQAVPLESIPKKGLSRPPTHQTLDNSSSRSLSSLRDKKTRVRSNHLEKLYKEFIAIDSDELDHISKVDFLKFTILTYLSFALIFRIWTTCGILYS